jgi:hypothetical protein
MSRAAVTVALSVVGTLAAVLLFAHLQPTTVATPVQSQELVQRLERLERAVNLLAEVRLGAEASAQRLAGATPAQAPAPPPSPEYLEKRDAAIRAGSTVIEQVVNTGRLTQQSSLELAVATTGLSGPDRAEVYAKLSQAINEGRVRLDRDVVAF